MQAYEQIDDIAKISAKIYKTYSYISEEEFNVMHSTVINNINEKGITDFKLYKEQYKKELYKLIGLKTVKILSDFNTKKEVFYNFIECNIKYMGTPEKNLLELKKLVSFLSPIGYFLDADDISLILSNPVFNKIVGSIINNNLSEISSNGLGIISKDSNIKSILQFYCDENDIDVKEETFDYEDDYDSYKSKLSIMLPNVGILSKEEERELLFKAKAGDKKAVEKLILHNTRLSLKYAFRYRKSNIPVEDLFQTGCIGIHRAIEKFDLSTNFKFSTYATFWIRQFIVRYIQENTSLLKMPINLMESYNKIKYASNKLSLRLGRNPTTLEISNETGLSEERINEILNGNKVVASFDSNIGDSDDTDLYNFVSYEDEDAIDSVFQEQLKKQLVSIIYSSYNGPHKERDIDIFFRRYGLNGYDPMKLDDIGKIYKITRERARQIENKVFLALVKHKSELETFVKFDSRLKNKFLGQNDERFIPTVAFYDYFEQFDFNKMEIFESLSRLPKIYLSILHNRFNAKDKNESIKTNRYFIAIVPNIVHAISDKNYSPIVESFADIKTNIFKSEKSMLESLLNKDKENDEKENVSNKRVRDERRTRVYAHSMPNSIHDMVIVGLRLGGINGVVYSKDEVSSFLGEKFIPESLESLMAWVEERSSKNIYYQKEVEFQEFLKERTLTEITFVGLSFGYVTGVPMETSQISHFLNIDEQEIEDKIGYVLDSYNGEDKKMILNRLDNVQKVRSFGSLI